MDMYRKRKQRLPPLAPKDFIQVWQRADSVAEVAMKVRRTKNACRVRAFRYRERGVPLKEFPPVEWVPPDWSELAAYAESLLPAGDDEAD
jgi:hypothetical protein